MTTLTHVLCEEIVAPERQKKCEECTEKQKEIDILRKEVEKLDATNHVLTSKIQYREEWDQLIERLKKQHKSGSCQWCQRR